MTRPRRPRPPCKRRPPEWLRDSLGQVLAVLTTALALAFVGIVNPAPVTGECSAGAMPESGDVRGGGVLASSSLTWADVVGRDGIEPPTLRFSAG
jgi:hypothetical protein